jgi:hypothetical protein
MANEYNVTIGTLGVRRETGEIVSISKNGVVFQFKKPRSSKRVQIEIDPTALLSLKENGSKSEVVFISAAFDLVDYSNITSVKPSEIPGINVGTTKQGEKLYFSPTRTNVTSLVAREGRAKKEKKASKPKAEGTAKKTKGKEITKPKW